MICVTNDDWPALLTAQRAQLIADLASAAEASAPVELDQSRVGRLSRMDAMQSQAMSQAADSRRHREIRQIDAALARVEAGTFGDCAKCDEPIAVSRLRFAPANPLCLDCAEELER